MIGENVHAQQNNPGMLIGRDDRGRDEPRVVLQNQIDDVVVTTPLKPRRKRATPFADYRRDRAFHAWKQAMWAAGLKLPTQVADGRAVCFCGAAIGIDDRNAHIWAAHMEG